MTLQQIRYLWEVYRHNLNVTAAARTLYTSQPGISKQLRLLEAELGVKLFARSGKRLAALTPAGEEIVWMARDVLEQVENVKRAGSEYSNETEGSLNIATTQTQALYALPPVVRKFRRLYPNVSLNLNQGTPTQLAELVSNGAADFAIATEGLEHFTDLVMFPCYTWNRAIVVPQDHAFAKRKRLRLEEIAKEPLVTYVFGFEDESPLSRAFKEKNLQPNVAFSAADTQVIKTYVRLGFGVGIIASMAYDSQQDRDLVRLSGEHLFERSVAHIAFRKGVFVRKYLLDFVELFAGHLTPKLVSHLLQSASQKERNRELKALELPHR